jgi:ubiquinone/menaquinone biosynthesis C-methylase UbiE
MAITRCPAIAAADCVPAKTHFDVLAGLVDLHGATAVDVGAGDGSFARQLATSAAQVTAIEIDEDKVAAGARNAPAGVEFRLGRAENLPVESAEADLVCFMFSFHHVPAGEQVRALEECARVLRPGGRLHVVDPLPHGGMTDIVKPLEDETDVRTRSQNRLRELAMPQFRLVEQRDYVLTRTFDSFDQVVERVTSANPARAAKLAIAIDAMKRAFDQHMRPTETGFEIGQPCAMFHFERT